MQKRTTRGRPPGRRGLHLVPPTSHFFDPRNRHDLARFVDVHGNRVTLHGFSVLPETSAWIFVDPDPRVAFYTSAPPCLSVANAKALVRGLQRFIEWATSPTSRRRSRRRRG